MTTSKVGTVSVTNPKRLVFEKEKISKLQVVQYYSQISKFILPFLKNRPISVIRCHGNINGEKFFKKHAGEYEDVQQIKVGSTAPYFYIQNKTQLIKQAQMGTIEFHTWVSCAKSINTPNMMIFDLDPDENLPLKTLQKGVLQLKNVLDELGLVSFLKTSGGKGYHVVVPLKNVKNYKILNQFASKIANFLEQTSNLFTTNIKKQNRKGKIFIDILRNKKGATCASAYSLRARQNAPISFPISWDNLNKIAPNFITLKNYKKYLNNSWSNFFKVNQTIN